MIRERSIESKSGSGVKITRKNSALDKNFATDYHFLYWNFCSGLPRKLQGWGSSSFCTPSRQAYTTRNFWSSQDLCHWYYFIFHIYYSSLLPLTSYSAFLCIFWFSVFLIPHSSIMVTVEVDPWTGPLNSCIFLLNSLKKTYYPCHLSPRSSWPWSFSKPFSWLGSFNLQLGFFGSMCVASTICIVVFAVSGGLCRRFIITIVQLTVV